MCGRFVLTDPSRIKGLMDDLFIDAQIILEFRPAFNIAPSMPVLSVLNQAPRALSYTRWGLIPAWAKSMEGGYKLINARAETLAEKPLFQGLVKKRRCIILADGFYEWSATPQKKPYYFSLKDNQPMALAGLWDRCTLPGRSEPVFSSTIITTTANSLVQDIHHRMPVIIPGENLNTWLTDAPISPEVLAQCLRAYPSEAMQVHAVSTLVNNPAHNSPECMKALAL